MISKADHEERMTKINKKMKELDDTEDTIRGLHTYSPTRRKILLHCLDTTLDVLESELRYELYEIVGDGDYNQVAGAMNMKYCMEAQCRRAREALHIEKAREVKAPCAIM